MKNTEEKCDKLIKIINNCKPVDFLHSKFQYFCQDMFYDNWKDICIIFQEEDYVNYYNYVSESFPFPESVSEEEKDIRCKFLTLSIFSWKSYLNHVFVVCRASKKGLNKFLDIIERGCINDDYLKNLVSYYEYYSRDSNDEYEQQEVDKMLESFSFVEDLSNIEMVYNANKSAYDLDEDEMQDMKDFFSESFVFYLEGLYLSITNFCSYLQNLKFKSKFNV